MARHRWRWWCPGAVHHCIQCRVRQRGARAPGLLPWWLDFGHLHLRWKTWLSYCGGWAWYWYIYIYIISFHEFMDAAAAARHASTCSVPNIYIYIYIYMIFVVNPLKIYLKCWCWHREISITLATLGHSLKKKSNFQRFIYHVKRWLDPQNPALWVPWILLCWTIIEVPSWLHTFRNLSAGYIVIHPQQYRGLVW